MVHKLIKNIPFLRDHHATLLKYRIFWGLFFIILGIIGLFVPILQGILFILIGLYLLFDKKNRIKVKKDS